jgi:uncharacterized protein YqhQ
MKESKKQNTCSIGGQAVIEGVMMKNKDLYAVAIRKPDKEILVERKNYVSFTKRLKILSLPIIRGAVAFFESMVLGMKILTFSAEFFEVEGEFEKGKFEKYLENKFGDKMNDIIIGLSVMFAIIMSIGLFVLLPLGLSQLLNPYLPSVRWMNLVDGIIRVIILLSYMGAISLMKDIQRVFQYHGAEHKVIHCLENNEELIVENAKKQSRLHKRCGTNFLLIVVLISVFVLTIINVNTFWLRFIVRIICLPIISGISYEVIKLFGKYNSKFIDFLNYPGLYLQLLTTREPDDSQLEVAIAALKGVLEQDDSESNS